ncbi:FMN-linked oxidoreductase [Aspergillus sclerotioniger CBS 115572]|uniref:FMN-linked oxidoreductase n=1 Tax=Aspergillus sclerotioniger CBS 115572 TaxID=1450535 RepID=A0A317XBR0_9EURO|nr:FMN-linked oxidoreductase [Aspergillus sclerotioniger CBS 115572]PWY93990.1 FMN-linked oxidoreductase [Aspergillus sclerotioniger CBS 115572]
MTETRLFKPLQIGPIQVQHRIGMAPLTRRRATPDRIPNPMMKEYYTQRASVPGTLIITEGTLISAAAAGGFPSAPGIWRADQIAAWKEITDAVHERGSFIYVQLFGMGRAAEAAVATSEGIEIVAPSAVPIPYDENPDAPTPRAMSRAEIQQTIVDFVTAAQNARAAGFDGVEIHGANGYLLDQFLQDTSNQRDDEYGGSVANRSRLLHEVLQAVVEVMSADRVGLRLSPWSQFQGMRMEDPVPQFADIVDRARGLDLAYLSLVEARIFGAWVDEGSSVEEEETLDFAFERWNGPILVAGDYGLEKARRLVDEQYPNKEIVVLFGRHFISNPDLVYRFKEGVELTRYQRETFYEIGSARGYVDYPFSEEFSLYGTEKYLESGSQ